MFAHNNAELKAWNAQLTESEDDSKSEGEFFYIQSSQKASTQLYLYM